MTSYRDSEGAFHEAARASTGSEDFGDEGYLDGLRMLLGSLDDEARLTDVGDLVMRGMIVEALKGRLRSESGFARFSGAEETPIDRPIFIVGLPRTGTTALHHLMAQNPVLQGLEIWLAGAPKPRPPRRAWAEDPDFVASDKQIRSLYERSPEMKAIHFMSAELPDECWRLFSQDFAHSSWEAQSYVPTYSKWWAQHDMRPAYRRHRRNLELIGHGEPSRRWLLKDATHLFALDALLDAYPDACIVQTHRDPAKLIGSVCSLCWSSRQPLNREDDPNAFGSATLALWERAIGSTMAARRGRPAAQFYDLPFERFVADPVRIVGEIHQYFGIDYPAEAAAAVAGFREVNPPGKHGGHSYRLSQWGLDAAKIRERFQPYAQEFDITPEDT
ncbi:MAG: sulfotransferase [Candidatus Binatia bacterium]|nr:sulfotransferase [Candidatus Binatia bacterium]